MGRLSKLLLAGTLGFVALLASQRASAQSHSVTLNWTPAAPGMGLKGRPIAGYTPMRSTHSGGPYTALTQTLQATTRYIDTTVEAGQTYYYVVTATDTAGAVSAPSNEVMAVIPGGPISISNSFLPGATVGLPYSVELKVSGGTPPYRCTWDGLVAGIRAKSCSLDGTPKTPGSYTFKVTVVDATVPTRTASASFSGIASRLQSPTSFWPDAPKPAHLSGSDSSSVEIGMRFTPRVAGTVTAIRLYRAQDAEGPSIVTLWDASGSSLSMAKAPKGSGWVIARLAKPVPLKPGLVYTVSYHTSRYAWNQDFFTAPLASGPFTAPADAGVFSYGDSGAFPSRAYRSSNYWVDVVFMAGAAPAVRVSTTESSDVAPLGSSPRSSPH